MNLTYEQKAEFASVLVERFHQLDGEESCLFMESLLSSQEEIDLVDADCDSTPTIEEWAKTIKEILFPETIGELHFGSMPTRKN